MTTTTHSAPDRDLVTLLQQGISAGASDLHLVPGYPPSLRIHGELQPIADAPLTEDATERMIRSILPANYQERFGREKDLDFSLSLPKPDAVDSEPPDRFRINVFFSQSATGACIRFIPNEIPSFEWMGLPLALARRIIDLHSGLVLITGITGAGKTTTLAGLVQLLNEATDTRIITVEEPVEYLFRPVGRSVITQREVGVDVDNFAIGLRSALRQDPDAILCGEIRDIDTARMALSAAETGHLVMSTVHTQDAKGAITRLVDIFPADRQQDIRAQLSLSLRYVISQHLLPNVTPGQKRVLAMEILVANDAVRSTIRMNKLESIDNLIQTGRKYGMQPLDEHLATLVINRQISADTAYRYAKNPAGLQALGVPASSDSDIATDMTGGGWR